MSVTIAVPAIPAEGGEPGNAFSQDGGLISPGIGTVRATVSIQGGDVGAYLDIEDYGIEDVYVYGANPVVQPWYTTLVVDTINYYPMIGYTLYYNAALKRLEFFFGDAPVAGAVEIWFLGGRTHDR